MAKTQLLGEEEFNNGDWFLYPCQHVHKDGTLCKRTLKMRVNYSSTMECYVPAANYPNYFDMRNQLWYCHQHNK